MVLAITYGDDNFSQSTKYNLKTAIKNGKVDKTVSYGPGDLDSSFITKNREILSAKRGAGYWVWKPYVINKALDEITVGDYLVYADSGSFYVENISYLIAFMNKVNTDIFVGKLEHPERKYSKRDAFVLIGVDNLHLEDSPQFEASFILIKKNEKTVRILHEWLEKSCDIRIISDNRNTCGLDNYEGFIENRYDQTVLSLLLKKHGYKGYRPVDIKMTKDNVETYPQIIVRTRYRNCPKWKFYLKIAKKWFDYYSYKFLGRRS